MIALALAALAAASDPHPRALVGRYDGGQHEVAASLELNADGRFRYALAYGALDEDAKGRWEASADGATVMLTTEPAVTPPAFALVEDKPDIMGGLFVTFTDPRPFEGARPRVVLFYEARDEPLEAEVADDGRVELPDSRRPSALSPELPVYPVPLKPTPLTGKSGHRLTFRFEANDLGRADFRDTPLRVEGGALLLERYGVALRFQR